MMFENVEDQIQHLYKHIYQGIKHLKKENPRMTVEFKHNVDFFHDLHSFKIGFHPICEWQLNFYEKKQLVTLRSSLSHQTEYYKYDNEKHDWVHAKQPNEKDSLFVTLYQELDAHLSSKKNNDLEWSGLLLWDRLL